MYTKYNSERMSAYIIFYDVFFSIFIKIINFTVDLFNFLIFLYYVILLLLIFELITAK